MIKKLMNEQFYSENISEKCLSIHFSPLKKLIANRIIRLISPITTFITWILTDKAYCRTGTEIDRDQFGFVKELEQKMQYL